MIDIVVPLAAAFIGFLATYGLVTYLQRSQERRRRAQVRREKEVDALLHYRAEIDDALRQILIEEA